MIIITPDILRKISPYTSQANAEIFAPILTEHMPLFGIETVTRVELFLAHLSHESASFSSRSENLNYSTVGLLNTFKKYFNAISAALYARKPEKIANKVYANRYGNGDEKSGDGWKYRGRGCIMTTFKDNYRDVGHALGLDLVNHPELLEQPVNSVKSACYYWKSRNINSVVGMEDALKLSTLKINGGLNGLEDRRKLYEAAKLAIV